MTSPISRFLRRSGGGNDPPLGGTRRDEVARSIDQRLRSEVEVSIDTAAVTRADRIYNKPFAVSLGERFVDTQLAALEAIRGAREEQRRLADEAEDLALSSQNDNLNYQRIQQFTEITRIKNAASVNGIALFSGTPIDLSLTDISRQINKQFVLQNSSTPTAPSSVSLSTPSQASAAKTTFEQALVALAAYTAGVSGIDRKISTVVSKEDPNVIADKAEAEAASRFDGIDPAALASAIASQITDPFLNERARQSIIETASAKLEPERVQELLKEEDDEVLPRS